MQKAPLIATDGGKFNFFGNQSARALGENMNILL